MVHNFPTALADRPIASLQATQAALREALEQATDYGDPSIWNRIARALGNVRTEIGRFGANSVLDDTIAAATSDESLETWHATAEPSLAELAELILAALVSAEALDCGNTALILNDALISVTGKGISPEGWSAT